MENNFSTFITVFWKSQGTQQYEAKFLTTMPRIWENNLGKGKYFSLYP